MENPTHPSGIEILESRIAPASLINAKTLVYTDIDGDTVHVTFNADVLTATNVDQVFKFSTGSVNGDSSVRQELETINLGKLGKAADGINLDVSVTATVGDGFANVFSLASGGRDLGNVTVDGYLGRIQAGDESATTLGIQKLDVQGFGQASSWSKVPGASTVFGGMGEFDVAGDFTQVLLQVPGKSNGVINKLDIGGSLVGGAGAKSGAILLTGDIGSLSIGTDIQGGSGAQSGHIGTDGTIHSAFIGGGIIGGAGRDSGVLLAGGDILDVKLAAGVIGFTGKNSGQIGAGGALGTVAIKSDLVGGSGKFSGSVLSAKGITSIIVDDVTGGVGKGSGQIGTSGALGSADIGSLFGGPGKDSGSLLATGSINSVHVFGALSGGGGIRSGHIGSADFIGSVTIDSDVSGGAAIDTGAIQAVFGIGTVKIGGNLTGGTGENSGTILSQSYLTEVTISGLVEGGTGVNTGVIAAKTRMGMVHVAGDGIFGAEIHSGGGIASVTVDGAIWESFIYAENGSIGSLTAGNADFSDDVIVNSKVWAGGDIGPVHVTTNDSYGILFSEFRAGLVQPQTPIETGVRPFTLLGGGGRIQSIQSDSYTEGSITTIANSIFNARLGIGNITTTGNIDHSAFISGVNLGANLASPDALPFISGQFNNDTAETLGFGGKKGDTDVVSEVGGQGIGNVNVGGEITTSYFLGGVLDAGPDQDFGTLDDGVLPFTSITGVSADYIATIHAQSGSIGPISAGQITADVESVTNFLATDFNGPGIGTIDVTGFVGVNGRLIAGTNFLSNSGIGTVTVTGDAGIGIFASHFMAEGSMGGFQVTLSNLGGTVGLQGVTAVGSFINDSSIEIGARARASIISGGGIEGSYFTSSGDIGFFNVFVEGGDGIVSSEFQAGGNIADMTVAAAGTGMDSTSVKAGGSITDFDITGASGVTGSTFQAGQDIGHFSATNITQSGFNAGRNIASISVETSISQSIFVAGNYLGSDFKVSGPGGAPSVAMGFGGTGTAADVPNATSGTIGDVSASSVSFSSFIAGVTGPGVNNILGDSDDGAVTNSSVHFTVTNVTSSFIEARSTNFTGSTVVLVTS